MINKTLLTLLVALFISGCGGNPSIPRSSESRGILSELSQMDAMKQELKQLRNSVEQLQFEAENARQKRMDLYQDMDRRMVNLERQSTGAPGGGFGAGQSQGQAQGQAQGQNDQTASGVNQTAAVNGTQTDGTAADNVTDSAGASASASNGLGDTVEIQAGTVSLPEQEAYEQAFELLKKSRYEDAVKGLQAFIDAWPNSQLADDAFYWMAEAHYVNREFEYALSEFRTVVGRYPDGQRVPEALLKIGYIQHDIGSYNDAANTFRDILARFPGHNVANSAQTRLRRIEQIIQ